MKRAALALCAAALVAGCQRQIDPTNFVDPFIGTGAHGHTYPGATVPFGMVQLSPDNGRSGWDWCSGYNYADSIITGFSHTHLSGTGIGDLADIEFMPTSRRPDLAWEPAPGDTTHPRPPWASRFSHDRERASPGYYSVVLDGPDVRAELTATEHAGVHRYSWLAPDSATPGLVIDLGFAINWDRPTDTALRIVSDTMVAGHRFSTGWAKDEKMFFVARFSRPITAHEIVDPADTVGAHTRAYLQFARGGGPLVVRVGISYVDEDGALRNLEAETAPSFDQLRGTARAAWRRALGGVKVRGGDDAALHTFYTALYHTKLAPIVFQDVDGRYRGADGEVHTASGFTNYSIFSLWDTFRAEHPLLTILEPERVGSMVQSMLAFRDQSGWLPVWSLVGNETNTMTGYHAAPVIADAILKGIGGFNADSALAAMVQFGERDWRGLDLYRKYGYVPSDSENESVTKTLEYAYDDWAVAQAARRLRRYDDYVVHMRRSTSWMNVFDATTRFARGKNADGTWVAPFDPLHSARGEEHTDYTEGNAWQHTWFVPQDPRGLIDEMGGGAPFIAKLDSLFTQDTTLTGDRIPPDISGLIGQYAHGNEPSHHIAYLYDYAGAPWKTQREVRRIMDTLYSDKPAGLPGNEDCGQISAWYVFSAMGFYPANPVGGVYALGSPRFDDIAVDVGGGRTFRVVADGAGEGKPYIQSATLNGKPLDRSWITHSDIMAGGKLVLHMGAEPNRAWASARSARPPSLAGPASMTAAGRQAMADVVRTEFRRAWDGYRQYAWGHDALRPLSRTGRDWYDHSLLMTPVDGFDTMLLMGLKDRAAAAKELVLDSLSFDRDMNVQVFEVTIRLLGGLLSAHLLDGDRRFLSLATDLANRLLPAFDTPTGMPCRFVNLRTSAMSDCVSNPAEIGTLLLEFGTLSRLTGDTTYMRAARRALDGIYQRRSAIGLVGSTIDVKTGEWQDADSHVGGGIDSYYEYLVKGARLFHDPTLAQMADSSLDAVNRWLADERDTGLWYGHADMNTGERSATTFGALEAFLPAVFVLHGDTARAERLETSVWRMWMRYGIEPEQLDYTTMEATYPGYPLRPEAIESAYYLWKATGDPRYVEMGWAMFRSLVAYARTDAGYAQLHSVITMDKDDAMPSFFLAETLRLRRARTPTPAGAG
ncbi:MAG: GH92 family glycosyl hydrolase [Gemmatimonadota bacterium]